MTENEVIQRLKNRLKTEEQRYGKEFVKEYFDDIDFAISALKEVQQYREIGTLEEIRKIIKQGIDNCYMAHRYEHPGYEEDLCAGLRTMNGEGEPCDTCKECYLYYGNQIWGNNNEDD